MTFGWATITAVVYDHDADRADLRARDLVRDCHSIGIMARIEDLNAAEAIEATWPANGMSNVRRPLITGANFADLIPPPTTGRACRTSTARSTPRTHLPSSSVAAQARRRRFIFRPISTA